MPDRFLDVIPVLPCADIRAEHDFLIDAFGFESAGLHEVDGRVVHGEVRAGARRFWLHEAQEPWLLPPRESGGGSAGVVVHVVDVDAHFAHARAAGAEILREPIDEDYGQREYGVRDREGHHWYFATPLD